MHLVLLVCDYSDQNIPDPLSVDYACAIVWATRDIQVGEEICISYVNVQLHVEERRRILLENYGFVCDCPKCKKELDANFNSNIPDDIWHHIFSDMSVVDLCRIAQVCRVTRIPTRALTLCRSGMHWLGETEDPWTSPPFLFQ